MAHGGARPGAGRKRGSRTKNPKPHPTRAKILAMEAAAAGLTPVDYLLGIMRNEKLELPVRLEAAKAVAPYVHPRLASLEARVESVHTMSGPVLDLRAVEILSSLDQLVVPAIEDEDEELDAVPLLSGPSNGS